MLKRIRLQNVLVLMGLFGGLGWVLAQENLTSSKPPLEKDAAIARIAKIHSSLGNLEQAQETIERRLLLVLIDGVFPAVAQVVGIVALGGDR